MLEGKGGCEAAGDNPRKEVGRPIWYSTYITSIALTLLGARGAKVGKVQSARSDEAAAGCW